MTTRLVKELYQKLPEVALVPGFISTDKELAARLLYQLSQQELTLKKLMKCSAPALQTLL